MQNQSYWYYGIGDWDADYPRTLHEEHRCKGCEITYRNGTWEIPLKYQRATERQVKCVEIINYKLGTHFDPILKSTTSKFISDHITESMAIHKESQPDDFQYENDVWCEHY